MLEDKTVQRTAGKRRKMQEDTVIKSSSTRLVLQTKSLHPEFENCPIFLFRANHIQQLSIFLQSIASDLRVLVQHFCLATKHNQIRLKMQSRNCRKIHKHCFHNFNCHPRYMYRSEERRVG